MSEPQPKKGANWGSIALLAGIPLALVAMVVTGIETLSPPKAPPAPLVRPRAHVDLDADRPADLDRGAPGDAGAD